MHIFSGDLAAAASLVAEARSVAEATGSALAPYGEVGLAAVQGYEEQAEPLIQSCLDDVVARGEGVGLNMVHWARAVLCNGLGRYGEAVAAAREAAADPWSSGRPSGRSPNSSRRASAARSRGRRRPRWEQLSAMTRASGTDWALGIEAGRCALLRDGAAAEALYREAIERLGRTRMRVELARAQLLYGEWLRREGRRVDARAQLRTAYEALTAMGVEAFADRARRELLATGETVRKRTVETSRELTPQEAHIARLVADGLTNPEIGASLYLSPRTVEWHLRKVFAQARRQHAAGSCAERCRRPADREDGQAGPRAAATCAGDRRSQPWKGERSPASHAARSPGLLRSQSGRTSLVAARRSCQRSSTDGRPQNQ